MSGAPTPEKPSAQLRGCLRNGILGCGSVLLVFLAMVTFVVSIVSRHPERYRPIVGRVFDTLEDSLVQNAGSDVSAAERAALAQARDRFRKAWDAGALPASAADRLRKRLIADSRKGTFGPAEVRELTDLLNDLSARR